MKAQTFLNQAARRFISFVGRVRLTDLPDDWQQPVQNALNDIEAKNPEIKKAQIRGANPHKSHDDPSDPLDVISVRLLKESGSRVDTIHIHQNGSTKSKRG